MSNTISNLRTKPENTFLYKDILACLPYTNSEYLINNLKNDYSTNLPMDYNLLGMLSKKDQDIYLSSLVKITRLRAKLYSGLELTLDEVELLLLKTRSDQETIAIITNFYVPLEVARLLVTSKRPLTRNAYTLLIRYHMMSKEEWAYEALRLNSSKFDMIITNLLISNPEFKTYFESKIRYDSTNFQLEIRFLTQLNRYELIKRKEFFLSNEFSKIRLSKEIDSIVVKKYLYVLGYALTKNSIDSAEILQLSKAIDEDFSSNDIYDKHGNLISDDYTEKVAKTLAVYCVALDQEDYEYILKSTVFGTSLSFRDDINIDIVESYMNKEYSIDADGVLSNNGIVSSSWDHIIAMVRVLDDSLYGTSVNLSKSIYKLVPYYILIEDHRSIESGARKPSYRRRSGHMLSIAFDGDQVVEINDLYLNLTVENYPNINPVVLIKIRKRLTYAYKNLFNFQEGKFVESGNRYKRQRYDNSEIAKVSLPIASRNLAISGQYLQALKSVEDDSSLEKFILMYNNRYKINMGRLMRSAGHHYAFTYLYSISGRLSLDQFQTAVVMLDNWEGTAEEFEKMVVIL